MSHNTGERDFGTHTHDAQGRIVPNYISDVANVASYNGTGYFSLLTNFYFTGGVATETEIQDSDVGEWVDVNFTVDPQGTFDYRPEAMKDAVADPFDPVTQKLTLEGLSLSSYGQFRSSLSFEPEVDEGQFEARLLFTRHSGTTPSDDFPIEEVVMTMASGADVEYAAEPFLSFFVGDTIDTNGVGDAGCCKFQVKSSVEGIVRMRALTWYLTE